MNVTNYNRQKLLNLSIQNYITLKTLLYQIIIINIDLKKYINKDEFTELQSNYIDITQEIENQIKLYRILINKYPTEVIKTLDDLWQL